MRLVAALLPVLLAAASPSAAPVTADAAARFRIIDRMGPTELSESTDLYVDAQRIGTFRLDARTPHAGFTVTLPPAPSYHYALCGHVVTQAAGAPPVTHRVDTAGTITDADGRIFEALTINFRTFYLADETPDREPTEVRIGTGHGCAPMISERGRGVRPAAS